MDVSKLKIYTGAWRDRKNWGPTVRPVSCCMWAPHWKGPRLPSLAPTRQTFVGCQTVGQMAKAYKKQILADLDPKKVANEIGNNGVLCCFEEAGAMCHRRLIAEWLEKYLKIKITEVGFPRWCIPNFVDAPENKYPLGKTLWTFACGCGHDEPIRLTDKAFVCSSCGKSNKVKWE